MEWKYEAIRKLQSYEARKRALDNLRDEYAQLQAAFVSIHGATADSVPVIGGGNKREDVTLNNIVHRKELRRNHKLLKRWVEMMDRALGALDEDERKVLDRFHINPAKGNVERLCEEFNCEKSTAYRRRDDALHHFTLALYGFSET